MAGEDIEERRELLLDGWTRPPRDGAPADRTQSVALPVSEWMIANTLPAPGEQVLELAAGPGDTVSSPRLIEPGGTLICSDAVSGMLDVARERAESRDRQRRVQAAAARVDRPTDGECRVVLCVGR